MTYSDTVAGQRAAEPDNAGAMGAVHPRRLLGR